MRLFDLFRRHPSPDADRGAVPEMAFGFRGEDISYRLAGRELEISFTYMAGPRVYTDSIVRWRGGPPLTDAEKERVFDDVITFLRGKRDKPVVVINADDPSRALWERLCAARAQDVKSVEHTSDEAQRQAERDMYLGTLAAAKGVVIDGTPIRSAEELDRFLANRPKRR
jgi:hypothetical protein